MIKLPAIVTFANQKGGVGKTTLCVLFAHYLVTKGLRVHVVDCDPQRSIVRRRSADIERYGGDNIPFDVSKGKTGTREELGELLTSIFSDREYDITLLDTPGNVITSLSQYLISNAHMLVVPFHYDKTTLSSTSTFIICLDHLKRNLGEKMKARLYLVPNLHDSRVGTRKELQLWDEARETYSRYGTVTPKIPRVADMERFSTVMNFDQQAKYVTAAFDKLYFDIFETLDPYRETGNQESGQKEQKTPDTPTLVEVAHELAKIVSEENVESIEIQTTETTTIDENHEQ